MIYSGSGVRRLTQGTFGVVHRLTASERLERQANLPAEGSETRVAPEAQNEGVVKEERDTRPGCFGDPDEPFDAF